VRLSSLLNTPLTRAPCVSSCLCVRARARVLTLPACTGSPPPTAPASRSDSPAAARQPATGRTHSGSPLHQEVRHCTGPGLYEASSLTPGRQRDRERQRGRESDREAERQGERQGGRERTCTVSRRSSGSSERCLWLAGERSVRRALMKLNLSCHPYSTALQVLLRGTPADLTGLQQRSALSRSLLASGGSGWRSRCSAHTTSGALALLLLLRPPESGDLHRRCVVSDEILDGHTIRQPCAHIGR
jgi:hypothetical protein